MVKAVTFDWWHTIAEPHKHDPVQGDSRAWEAYAKQVRVEGLAAVLRLHKIEASEETLGRAYDAWTEDLKEVWDTGADLTAEEQVLELLEAAGLEGKATPALLQAMEEPIGAPLVMKPPAVYTDFAEVAASLRSGGLAVGLVSNSGRTWGRYIRRVQRELGLLDLFDVTVFSDEVRKRKPAPEIFEAALKAVGVAPRDAVHVGDDPEADIEGAQRLGMRAVFLDRGKHACDFADATVRSFADLPGVLAKW